MARPIAVAAKLDTSGAGDELPADLRPDAWREWLSEVHDEPTTEFEKDIAYPDGWTANPFGSTAEKRAYALPTPIDGWREEVAAQLQWRARDEWRAAQ
ncbi:hypothetical protein ACN9MI_09745 [Rhodococcoides fascians]|uniref:hypothetical protein n=1 Tax=Nocardiaceae TaxID=85025 RepID=UPI000B9C1E89|nr:hypothetical protein [Rhodococcus sp. 15-649-2-2]OZE77372.1 hypothetical protein CH305_19405 [Rhodococcus sp. 15-649-2-2]